MDPWPYIIFGGEKREELSYHISESWQSCKERGVGFEGSKFRHEM